MTIRLPFASGRRPSRPPPDVLVNLGLDTLKSQVGLRSQRSRPGLAPDRIDTRLTVGRLATSREGETWDLGLGMIGRAEAVQSHLQPQAVLG